ncbi:fibroblast growth factor-binding protein 1 [Silurus asotus]|uniref:Fibroblast growth factor-binding protein 1 n=1 Tax=Silurus asotus TaxID=30991 RepID=A0AAD5FT13_SILAS|nr:fibroblast growth factor-binding protein 1 [Silurus asotus]
METHSRTGRLEHYIFPSLVRGDLKPAPKEEFLIHGFSVMPRLMKWFFLILLVFFVLVSSSEAKKKTKQKPGEEKTPSSGELNTTNGDRCTWQTHEGKNKMVLHLKCSSPSDQRAGHQSNYYECQFTGKPSECPAYGDKPTQYWNQVLTRLKKRQSACEGVKVLKAGMCKSAPNSAHMRLVKKKEVRREKEGAAEEKKDDEEMMMADEGMSDGGAETESYCAEGWGSLCHLLTKLL